MTPKTDGALDHKLPNSVMPPVAGPSGAAFQLHHLRKVEAFGKLAGGVAHDFNNLLTIISGYSEMLLGEFDLHDSRRELLEEVQRAAGRATTLASQLLAFSRLQRFSPRVISLGSVVLELRKMIQRLAGEDIRLLIKACENAGRVFADPRQIEIVLINLAVNAREAMPCGGQLSLEVSNVHLSAGDLLAGFKPGPYVQLAVIDTGLGIDEATRARIFEPFFTTKMAREDAGMGLPICQRIIKKCGGHINFESAPGHGSTFRIFLPFCNSLSESRKKQAGKPDAALLQGNGEAILLVEDDPAVQRLYQTMLTSLGYIAISAGDSDDALRIASHHPEIRLVIADSMMSMEDVAIFETALKNFLPNTRLLLISGYAFEPLESLDEITHIPFLPKPLSRDSLSHTIRELLATA